MGDHVYVYTASVMKSAIDKCCGIKSVRVRRTGRCWWFVLHDKENVLCSLEEKWSQIEMWET